MFIKIDGTLLKELELFTSKLQTREIFHCINIKVINGANVVFAATDGIKLYTHVRQQEADEVFELGADQSLTIKIPKVKGKGMYFLRDVKKLNRYILTNPLTKEEVICIPFNGNYPKYETVLPAYPDQWPKQEKYVSFAWENLKALQTVISNAKGTVPRALKVDSAHYWMEQNDLWTKEVVIMPYHLSE